MVTTLGTSVLVVGLIEGAAEATALMVKVFSGVLSDYWGQRKPLAVLIASGLAGWLWDQWGATFADSKTLLKQ